MDHTVPDMALVGIIGCLAAVALPTIPVVLCGVVGAVAIVDGWIVYRALRKRRP